ncbi:MAG: glycosyltransferase family 39 protein [bacterium]
MTILCTVDNFGITFDEPCYFKATYLHTKWIDCLKNSFLHHNYFHPFSSSVISTYWEPFHNHPSFTFFISNFFWNFYHNSLGDIKSYRLSGAFFFALLISSVFMFASKIYGIKSGIISSLSLLLLPRVFGDSYLLALDIPITCMWFLTIYAFYKSFNFLLWKIIAGILFGFALATKINAFLIPIPLFIWTLIYYRKRKYLVNNFLWFGIIGFIVFIISWPWLWHQTFFRLTEYLLFHKSHFYVSTYYFGKAYTVPPWHYPFVMTLITIPISILLFILIGLFQKNKSTSQIKNLFILNFLIPFLISAYPKIPKYDGVRLFMSVFPFMTIFAGIGFNFFIEKLELFFKFINKTKLWVISTIVFLIINIFFLMQIHPYERSYYNFLIGGTKGAYKKGMEITYWNEPLTSKPMIEFINSLKGNQINILVHGGSPYPLILLQHANLLKKNIKFISNSSNESFLNEKKEWDYFLLNCRFGFFNDNDWQIFKKKKPIFSVKCQKVPLALLYTKEEVKDLLK